MSNVPKISIKAKNAKRPKMTNLPKKSQKFHISRQPKKTKLPKNQNCQKNPKMPQMPNKSELSILLDKVKNAKKSQKIEIAK